MGIKSSKQSGQKPLSFFDSSSRNSPHTRHLGGYMRSSNILMGFIVHVIGRAEALRYRKGFFPFVREKSISPDSKTNSSNVLSGFIPGQASCAIFQLSGSATMAG